LGGVLADHMGLGKSLAALALICCTVEQARLFSMKNNISGDPRITTKLRAKTTLLITPTSSKYGTRIQTHYGELPDVKTIIALNSWGEQVWR
jgi:hypothetical protein